MENGMEREKTKGQNVKTGPQAGLFSLIFAAAFQKGLAISCALCYYYIVIWHNVKLYFDFI